MKILLIDNFDSFSWNLLDYFKQLDCEVKIIQNDIDPQSVDMNDIDALVLSPGPGRPEDAGYLMQWIALYHQSKAILGICLGHQALGQFYHMDLIHAIKPMHGKVSLVHCRQHPIHEGLNSTIEVMRYHSLVLSGSIDSEMQVIASTTDDEIMSIAHKSLPLIGLQYHPESILTGPGLQILANWKQWISQSSREKNN
jgi:anthranilate synthase/aminodeoxychorismate synthase-like glutamine amidotransferase